MFLQPFRFIVPPLIDVRPDPALAAGPDQTAHQAAASVADEVVEPSAGAGQPSVMDRSTPTIEADTEADLRLNNELAPAHGRPAVADDNSASPGELDDEGNGASRTTENARVSLLDVFGIHLH